ncbi:MAG: aminoglycoside phosphotransferase family protein [Chloroflexota bacterium]
MPLLIPPELQSNCQLEPGRAAWLRRLEPTVQLLARQWALTLQPPFPEATAAWAAPVTRADGTSAVLKLGMPHLEADHEAEGLAFWDGDPTVYLLASDPSHGAMLLERCEPGLPLRSLPEPEQDAVIAQLLRRLWRPVGSHWPFRPLSAMLAYWAAEAERDRATWVDPALVQDGLRLYAQLSPAHADDVLLATDLHAGNVLRAQRAEWLAIDPKPFVGDRAYDATQHLLNCRERLLREPGDTVARIADLLEVPAERVRLWTFARLAVESRRPLAHAAAAALARVLAR